MKEVATKMVESARDEWAAPFASGFIRPWSLWDLLNAYAAAFFQIAQWFDALHEGLAKLGHGPISDELLRDLVSMPKGLPNARIWAGQLGMTKSMELIYQYEMQLHYEPERYIASQVCEWLDAITKLMESELNEKFLYHVPDSLPVLCSSPREGWGDAPDRFKTAARDIDEASSSTSCGRSNGAYRSWRARSTPTMLRKNRAGTAF